MRLQYFLPTLLLLTFLCTSVRAQKAITVPDMQAWHVIDDEEIGADGRFVLYTLKKDVGDPIAVVYDSQTKTERRFPRLHRAQLSYDGQHLIGLLKPGMATVKHLKLSEKKKAKDKLAKMDSLLVWHLTEAEPQIIPQVYDFKAGERWSDRYAYTTASALPDSLQKGLDKSARRLLVRSFTNTDSFYLEGVSSFVLARDAAVVLAHQTAKDSTWEASILRLTADELQWKTISKGEGDYTALTLNNDGSQVAFLTSNKDAKDAQKPFHLHHWSAGSSMSKKLTGEALDWMPKGSRISDDRAPKFSENGEYLFFGTTPRRPERDTNLLDEEIADVEVWTTDDAIMYTRENLRLKAEEKRTFLAVYRTKANNFLQVGTPDWPDATQPNELDGHYVLLNDDRPYSKQSMWEGFPGARNTTVVDLRTGERKAMFEGKVTPARWLDGGKFLVWYNQTDTTWNSFDPATGQGHVLTTNATGVFYDEINDRPMHPSSYRYQGTLVGGDKFLVADRYDLWQLDPSGKEKPVRLTQGREKNTRYFLQDLDREDPFIDPTKSILAATFHQDTYHEGYGWLDLTDGSFTSLNSGPKNFGDFAKARSAEHYLYTQSDFREFPDLRLTGDLAEEGAKISSANPQQKDFAWGTNETYEWTDLQGRTLKGMLIKPDNFDPNKKYPLMVNYYERSSERVYRHQTPLPGRSSINYSHYVSKGYVIFNPDVVYRVGYPGESAYDCVMSGLTSLLAEGFIDKKRIGMQGHSWGGYQAAYLVTKTDMFAAVEAGAPVVNMFSAYGGIRWGSGLSRQFQYEHTQSRIGGTPWSHFQRYYENSPLFTTDKINTPLLILHNDHDGAVPWEQGIEWFTALRRLGKKAWKLNYRGEPHWPLKPANRADFQTRMAAFFDHYLMGQPMPRWMSEGVKPIQRAKGRD